MFFVFFAYQTLESREEVRARPKTRRWESNIPQVKHLHTKAISLGIYFFLRFTFQTNTPIHFQFKRRHAKEEEEGERRKKESWENAEAKVEMT